MIHQHKGGVIMTRKEEVALYLMGNPNATNNEIAETVGISEGYAKKIVSELKRQLHFDVNENNGERTIQVIKNIIRNERTDMTLSKREKLERLLDILIEAMEHETKFENLVAGSHAILKITDRL